MKLNDLRPAPGSRAERTRVGRGIAAGKGKTAGRGTKGQKARAGGSIPPWFEGGQTPLHQRIPKLRGFRNRFKTQYEVVNVGRIAELVESGRIPSEQPTGRSKKDAGPVTVNQEVLRAAGAVSTLAKPMKILGAGDVSKPLFVVADAFTRSAREKIESAGGTAQLLEVPTAPLDALRPEPAAAPDAIESAPAPDATESAPAPDTTQPQAPAEETEPQAPAEEPTATDVAGA
jgi:large subunit ribosomal protein L15